MTLTPLEQEGGYSVCLKEEVLGTVTVEENPFHRENAYVKLDFTRWEESCAPELFEELARLTGRPLQVMTSSRDTQLTAFLAAGGFCRARRCWEMTVSPEDYLGPEGWEEPVWITEEDEAYDLCCSRLYGHYRKTHEAVNPLTVERDVFCACLPGTAACRTVEGALAALAFVEDSEIAYVWGRSKEEFLPFAADLIRQLFTRDRLIFFECDDCDEPALWLKGLFRPRDESSFDTYLYK